MINDASISGIIESLKKSNEQKLIHDQKTMKDRIVNEFGKLSKEGLLSQSVEEVYCIKFYDNDEVHFTTLMSAPELEPYFEAYLKATMKQFYAENESVNEDGFNLMTFLEFLLDNFNSNYKFWCSYPQISYDIIAEADTYYFTIIQFNKLKYKEHLSYKGKLHPFIKSLNYTWISQYKEPSYDNTFRKAAAHTNDLLGQTWDHVNILSAMKYEGSHNRGSLLFIEGHAPTILLSLEKPVPLSQYRQIRKLLQMSRSHHFLLIDSDYMAIGFGYIKEDEGLFRLDFLDHLNWKLYLGEDEFLSCVNLLPTLPNTGNNMIKLREHMRLTFSEDKYDEAILMEIIEEANSQHNGTMVVITELAADEAERLQTSSIKIAPTRLSKHQVKMVTSIDGALIIDTAGYCHAIGSILDGSATDNGDSSRGARYNSAIRYLNTQTNNHIPCLIAVISEDRYIDILSTGGKW